jgi:hypothetical protein
LLALRREKTVAIVRALKCWLDLMQIEQTGLPKSPLMKRSAMRSPVADADAFPRRRQDPRHHQQRL